MFPETIERSNKKYYLFPDGMTETAWRHLLEENPYGVLALMNERMESGGAPVWTTFFVLYHAEFEGNVLLYDVSRQKHTTVRADLSMLRCGCHEEVGAGGISRFPVRLYVRE